MSEAELVLAKIRAAYEVVEIRGRRVRELQEAVSHAINEFNEADEALGEALTEAFSS